jgi:hypothetical protein
MKGMEMKPEMTPALAVEPCSAGWWLTGWQRLWRKSPDDEAHELRIWRKLQAAEHRYQLENKMGRYCLPNPGDEPRRP